MPKENQINNNNIPIKIFINPMTHNFAISEFI